VGGPLTSNRKCRAGAERPNGRRSLPSCSCTQFLSNALPGQFRVTTRGCVTSSTTPFSFRYHRYTTYLYCYFSDSTQFSNQAVRSDRLRCHAYQPFQKRGLNNATKRENDRCSSIIASY